MCNYTLECCCIGGIFPWEQKSTLVFLPVHALSLSLATLCHCLLLPDLGHIQSKPHVTMSPVEFIMQSCLLRSGLKLACQIFSSTLRTGDPSDDLVMSHVWGKRGMLQIIVCAVAALPDLHNVTAT